MCGVRCGGRRCYEYWVVRLASESATHLVVYIIDPSGLRTRLVESKSATLNLCKSSYDRVHLYVCVRRVDVSYIVTQLYAIVRSTYDRYCLHCFECISCTNLSNVYLAFLNRVNRLIIIIWVLTFTLRTFDLCFAKLARKIILVMSHLSLCDDTRLWEYLNYAKAVLKEYTFSSKSSSYKHNRTITDTSNKDSIACKPNSFKFNNLSDLLDKFILQLYIIE